MKYALALSLLGTLGVASTAIYGPSGVTQVQYGPQGGVVYEPSGVTIWQNQPAYRPQAQQPVARPQPLFDKPIWQEPVATYNYEPIYVPEVNTYQDASGRWQVETTIRRW